MVTTTTLLPGMPLHAMMVYPGTGPQPIPTTYLPSKPPSVPVISASPLNITFTVSLSQPYTLTQIVTLKNDGGKLPYWRMSSFGLHSGLIGSYLSGGQIAPEQSAPLTIVTNRACIALGTYAARIALIGYDAQGNIAVGSPISIQVTIVIKP